jgi:hypothetical protein
MEKRNRAAAIWPGTVLLVLLLALAVPGPASAQEPPAQPELITIGYSVEGQPIEALRLGSGPRPLVVVGAIQGSEGNTEVLVRELATHFAATLHLLPPGVSLYFLPALSPDGLNRGSRYNANGVDLNRNWDSGDWQPHTFDSSGRVAGGGGSAPFSEPETKALADWLFHLRAASEDPVMVLFYHCAYPPSGLVLPGSVGAPLTPAFAGVVGYATAATWAAYPVTGTAPGWCARHGLLCFEVELPHRATLSTPQMHRHAAAILGVLLWEQTAPRQRCFYETGMCIAGRVREFWERNGAVAVFGLPITRQHEQLVDGVPRQVQYFERHRLELHPDQPPPHDVQVGRLGVEQLEQQSRSWWEFPRLESADDAGEGCRFFAETGHALCGEMLAAWHASGLEFDGQRGTSEAESLALFGMPLSEPHAETLRDGQTRTVQWFERARFEIHPQPEGAPRVLAGLLGSEAAPPR